MIRRRRALTDSFRLRFHLTVYVPMNNSYCFCSFCLCFVYCIKMSPLAASAAHLNEQLPLPLVRNISFFFFLSSLRSL